MPETTLEEARRCPKCEMPGQETGVTRLSHLRGATLHAYTCMNTRCKWYMTVCRTVQINPDGTIPPPQTPSNRDKKFPKLDPVLAAQMERSMESQAEAMTKPGAELHGR